MNVASGQRIDEEATRLSSLIVQQTTNPKTIRLLAAANFVVYFLLWYLNKEYPEVIPEVYLIFLLPLVILPRVLKKSTKSLFDNIGSLKFERNTIVTILVGLVPIGMIYLLLTYIIDISLMAEFGWYIFSLVLGVAAFAEASSYRVILKKHSVTFVRGVIFKKSKVVPYHSVGAIYVSAATDGISINVEGEDSRETCRWMGDIDNLQKLLQKRVQAARLAGPIKIHDLSFDDLVNRRLNGVITAEEFNAEIKRRSS